MIQERTVINETTITQISDGYWEIEDRGYMYSIRKAKNDLGTTRYQAWYLDHDEQFIRSAYTFGVALQAVLGHASDAYRKDVVAEWVRKIEGKKPLEVVR